MTAAIKGMSFAIGSSGHHLLQVNSKAPAIDALDMAQNLCFGINLLCEKLGETINEGELVYTSELRALSIMGELAGALTASVYRGMKGEGNHG